MVEGAIGGLDNGVQGAGIGVATGGIAGALSVNSFPAPVGEAVTGLVGGAIAGGIVCGVPCAAVGGGWWYGRSCWCGC